jgi:hypothetical protein
VTNTPPCPNNSRFLLKLKTIINKALEIIAILVWDDPSFFSDSIEKISIEASLIFQIDWKSKIATTFIVSISMGIHIFDLFSTIYSLIPRIPRIKITGISRFGTAVRPGVKTLQGGLLNTREYFIPKHSVFACKTLINLQPAIAIAKQQLPILKRWFSGIYLAIQTKLSCLSCACSRISKLLMSSSILAAADKEPEEQYTHMPKRVLHRIKRKNYLKKMIMKPFSRIESLIRNKIESVIKNRIESSTKSLCTIEEYNYIKIAEIKIDPVFMIEPTDRPPPALWGLVSRFSHVIFPEIQSSMQRSGKWSDAVSEMF